MVRQPGGAVIPIASPSCAYMQYLARVWASFWVRTSVILLLSVE